MLLPENVLCSKYCFVEYMLGKACSIALRSNSRRAFNTQIHELYIYPICFKIYARFRTFTKKRLNPRNRKTHSLFLYWARVSLLAHMMALHNHGGAKINILSHIIFARAMMMMMRSPRGGGFVALAWRVGAACWWRLWRPRIRTGTGSPTHHVPNRPRSFAYVRLIRKLGLNMKCYTIICIKYEICWLALNQRYAVSKWSESEYWNIIRGCIWWTRYQIYKQLI